MKFKVGDQVILIDASGSVLYFSCLNKKGKIIGQKTSNTYEVQFDDHPRSVNCFPFRLKLLKSSTRMEKLI